MSFILRCFWLLLFSATTALAQPASAPAATARVEPVLGVGDIVKISVYQNPDLSVDARVSELGQINFPLIGTVTLGGLAVSAAEQRIEVTKASVAEAEESLRITQNRYETGLSNVTDLLRTETAVLEARTRQLAAIHDQRIAAAILELAAGTLTADSEVLN